MAGVQIDPEAVIERLSRQIGQMAAELAMRDAALDAAHARITELEQGTAGTADTGEVGG